MEIDVLWYKLTCPASRFRVQFYSLMGLERKFRSRSGTSSEISGTGTELVPNSKIRNGTGTERPFLAVFSSVPERISSHFTQNSRWLFLKTQAEFGIKLKEIWVILDKDASLFNSINKR